MSVKTGVRAAWALARPYWVSEDRWPARGLLALVIAIDLARTWCLVRMTYWNRDFLDALAAFDTLAFWRQIWVFVAIAGSGIFLDTARAWFAQKLEIRWRSWLTDVFLDRWLAAHAYLRSDRAHRLDNPDQRIAEDLRLMAANTLELSLGLFDNIVKLAMYSAVVWSMSNTLVFVVAGVEFHIHGYLLWIALLYALAGSLLLEKFARPMVAADYVQQQREAHFRYLLVRLRENAEQVAFYRGERVERGRLGAAFTALRLNWYDIMIYTKRVTFIKEAYIEVGAFMPYLIIVPRYFAREITLGMVQQLQLTFSRVRGAMSWFIFSYRELSLLRAVYRRLIELDALLDTPPEPGGIERAEAAGRALRTRGLRLALPDGRPLVAPGDLAVRPGERWLVRGPSGSGKSTLLRALAGLWPHGAGRIEWPAGARAMFVPQSSYLPAGSLRACLCYPSDETAFDRAACAQALAAANLGELAGRLDEGDQWDQRLSPGEQQRLAFARVLLHRPDYLFMDEATSALDADNEAHLYGLLLRELPGLALVSVAHRASLQSFHTHALDFERGTGRAGTLPAAAA